MKAYPPVAELETRFGALEPSDIPSILAIELSGHAYPWSEAVFLDCFKPGYEVWGIWTSCELAGFAILCWQYDELHLLNLCVRRTYQHAGLGRRLLRFVIVSGRSALARKMILEVRASNQAAISLYQKEGFEKSGERRGYYPAGCRREDALVMELALS